jgi:hypothetical protein
MKELTTYSYTVRRKNPMSLQGRVGFSSPRRIATFDLNTIPEWCPLENMEVTDDLRDKVLELIIDARYTDSHDSFVVTADEIADSILALIDSQRCEWTPFHADSYKTECGFYSTLMDSYHKYCPCCGKRIHAVEAE